MDRLPDMADSVGEESASSTAGFLHAPPFNSFMSSTDQHHVFQPRHEDAFLDGMQVDESNSPLGGWQEGLSHEDMLFGGGHNQFAFQQPRSVHAISESHSSWPRDVASSQLRRPLPGHVIHKQHSEHAVHTTTQAMDGRLSPWQTMSSELLEHIFSFLDLKSLTQAAQTCRHWSEIRWLYADLRQVPPTRMSRAFISYMTHRRRPRTVFVQGQHGCARSGLNPQSFAELALNTALNELSVEAGYVGDEAAGRLAPSLLQLRRLNLSHNSLSGAAIESLCEALKATQSLQSLILRGNMLGAEGAAVLGDVLTHNQSIVHLDVSQNQIGQAGAAAFRAKLVASNSTLQHLNLSSNSLCGPGANDLGHAVSHLHALEVLDLTENNITDPGMRGLSLYLSSSSCCQLKELILEHNSLSAEGITLLSSALRSNRVVERINLSSNPFHAAGGQALSAALTFNDHLTYLNLSSCNIGATACGQLAALLAGNVIQHLVLDSNDICQQGATALASALTNNTSLIRLSLVYNRVADDGAAALCTSVAQHPRLAMLSLADNHIGERGLLAAANMVRTNTSLECMSLSGNSFSPASAMALGQALTENTTLARLTLRACLINEEAGSHLFQAMIGKRVFLSNLNIAGNSIGAAGASVLAKVMANADFAVTNMDLSGNNIGDRGTAFICSALQSNVHLTELRLCNNRLEQASGSAVSALLASPSCNIKSLDLSTNYLHAQGAAFLSQGIANSTGLETLSLANNYIDADGASHLALGLAHNASLRRMCLEDNPVGAAGIEALARAIPFNSTLCLLNLKNTMGDSSPDAYGAQLAHISSMSVRLTVHHSHIIVD